MYKNIPITRPYIGQQEAEAVRQVLESGWLVQGANVKEFEQRIAEHEQVKFCCAATSCTTALQLAMLAEGMQTGMDVLVPSFTFVATANAVVATGAVPVLMDVCSDTFNIDVGAAENYIEKQYCRRSSEWINKENGNKLWGIVPVHQFGLCADMPAIGRLADEYGIKVIEDAACALGAKIGDTHIGGFGNTACVSFHPRKSITTGEGGMVLTNDEDIYRRVVELRNHGSSIASDERHKGKGYLLPEFTSAGYNYRMTDIQGAIGCEQVKKLDHILQQRREQADIYHELLTGKDHKIKTPYEPEGYYHTYQSYVCLLDLHEDSAAGEHKRNQLMEELEQIGIITRQGTHAVHKLDYYKRRFGFKNTDLPVADRCDSLTVSLPVYVGLSYGEQVWIVEKMLASIEKME